MKRVPGKCSGWLEIFFLVELEDKFATFFILIASSLKISGFIANIAVLEKIAFNSYSLVSVKKKTKKDVS